MQKIKVISIKVGKYVLYKKFCSLRPNHKKWVFFFSKKEAKEDWIEVEEVPLDYYVFLSPFTMMPMLRKIGSSMSQ